MPEPIRVLLAENHPLILAGLRAVIADSPGMELVGTATTVREIWPVCQEHQPDVLLLGTTMPALPFMDTLAKAQQNYPELPVLVQLSRNPYHV